MLMFETGTTQYVVCGSFFGAYTQQTYISRSEAEAVASFQDDFPGWNVDSVDPATTE